MWRCFPIFQQQGLNKGVWIALHEAPINLVWNWNSKRLITPAEKQMARAVLSLIARGKLHFYGQ